MHVVNFSEGEVNASEVVKRFYRTLDGKEEYHPPIWSDTLDDHDQTKEAEKQLKQELERRYRSHTCKLCGASCSMKKVKKNSPNRGRWYLQCTKTYGAGHTYDFLT